MNNDYHTLRLILGDQLNAHHSWFRHTDDGVLYVIAELRQETDYTRHHVQKITAFFAAMTQFAHALQHAGHHVLHMTLDDTAHYKDLPALLRALIDTYHCQQFAYQRPDEFRLCEQMAAFCADLRMTTECVDSEHFLLPYEDIKREFKADKHVRMESFYRRMRKRTQYLMQDDEPLGGQWNYDADNRESFKASDLSDIPAPLVFATDVSDILARLSRHGVDHFGRADAHLLWPTTRRQSLQLLEHFCRHCLPLFGKYQDAMTHKSEHAWSLYHSRLSFAMNSKMLSPAQVVETAIAEYHARPHAINLAQIEGFVRQIIGWREYVRGMYWINMPHYASLNALQAKRPLPSWYWNGDTKMACCQAAIQQSLNTSYAHHIQRLMVTGNFALLAGIDPDQVDQWYLGIYIDAHEWVEMPNTRGMSLSADGGLIATKPYASSGNYINKMSDYCKDCYYNVKQRTGERACPFNALYWDFLDRHAERFGANPRMAFPYKSLARFSDEERQAIRQQATQILHDLDNL
ncbi:MAG TPA: cryptochrome/photolyase family protein [Pseudomonadales bacterium]|nr:cryptochrome/photolyase family protein [Pseudomonadales bacterium]